MRPRLCDEVWGSDAFFRGSSLEASRRFSSPSPWVEGILEGVSPGRSGRWVGSMSLKDGWRGRFFEDFEVGDVYRHPLGRTVTETDNVWFTLLTQNTGPVHFERHYGSQTEFGRR